MAMRDVDWYPDRTPFRLRQSCSERLHLVVARRRLGQMAVAMYGVLLAAMVATAAHAKPLETEADDVRIEMRMPNVQPTVADTYLCYAGEKGKDTLYLTGFIPHANMSTAHHILLYGCSEPGQDKPVWDCGEMQGTGGGFVKGPVCRSGAQIIYAWAMDAPELKLPPGVAFKVFGDGSIQQLVMQVHYKSVDLFVPPKNGTDNSGLTLLATTTPQPRRAGVYLLGTGGSIAPHSVVYMETACSVNDPFTIHPFAYRAHAHTHGEVVSGYRVRDGEWTELGRVSPKLPEMFYNVTSPGITVEEGDILAARCTMVNKGDKEVDIGQTATDEMCNFYIMYYVDGDRIMSDRYCFTPGPPAWNWGKFPGLDPANAPSNASLVPDSGKLLKATQEFLDNTQDFMDKENDLMEKQMEQFLQIVRNNLEEEEGGQEENGPAYGYGRAPYQIEEEPERLSDRDDINELMARYSDSLYDDDALYEPRVLRDYPEPFNPWQDEDTDNFY